MNIDFGPLGLSPDESAIYLLLIDRPSATPEDLTAPGTTTSGGSVATVLGSLQKKGLVTTLAGHPPRYAAIAPDVALDNLARAREEEIAAVRAYAGDLNERWRRAGRATLPEDLVEIVVGREATLQRSEQIQRNASEEIRMIDVPPYATEVVDNPIEAQILGRGDVRYRVLYDRSGLDEPGVLGSILSLVSLGEEARVASDLPLKMVMGDSSVAMLPLDSAPTSITAAVVIHPSALLTSLHHMFDIMWDRALPLRVNEAPEREAEGLGTELTEIERHVVQLLVTGMTDQAIGRQLGLVERTVQRRVQAIMRRLGVDNRLQLGMRLAERGWGA